MSKKKKQNDPNQLVMDFSGLAEHEEVHISVKRQVVKATPVNEIKPPQPVPPSVEERRKQIPAELAALLKEAISVYDPGELSRAFDTMALHHDVPLASIACKIHGSLYRFANRQIKYARQ